MKTAKAKAFKTYSAKSGEIQQKWYIVDAAGKSLGRISTVIARRLMGKDKPVYTSHIDTGDFVIVVNSEKVSVHQNKMDTKTYRKWSGFPGGLRVRTLAQELGPRGIRVNTVSAGVVDTDALSYFPNREELLANFARRTPLGPTLTPEDVAGAVYLLCLPDARMITGHTLVVDGGFCISG